MCAWGHLLSLVIGDPDSKSARMGRARFALSRPELPSQYLHLASRQQRYRPILHLRAESKNKKKKKKNHSIEAPSSAEQLVVAAPVNQGGA